METTSAIKIQRARRLTSYKRQSRKDLPPRKDIIEHNQGKHKKELEKKMQWRDCPEEHKVAI
jgi:hypothetical protein